jgi:LacI family transcriptional regulator
MYVSLKDVAARAGVSFQTASKVLNGRQGVASAATEERILDAARQLGYVPNALARGLVSRSSITVGILADDLADIALSRFIAGAQRSAALQGHAAVVVPVPADGQAAAALRKLLEHRVDGILVIAPSIEHDEHFGEELRDGLPLVSLNRLPGSNAILIGSDHRHTGVLAAEHLLTLGHRQIATITGPSSRDVVRTRLAGFEHALDEAGRPLTSRRVIEADWSTEHAYRAAAQIVDGDPDVTAIFAQSDLMAMGVLRLLADRNIGVPGQASVIGCDDLPFAPFLVPSLTTIHVPFEETGARAAALLLDLIADRPTPTRELLATELVVRASTGPPRPRRRRATRPRSPEAVSLNPPTAVSLNPPTAASTAEHLAGAPSFVAKGKPS